MRRVLWHLQFQGSFFLCLWLAAGCAHVSQHPNNLSRSFDFQQDTFAFINQTVWTYKDGKRVQTPESRSTNEDRYVHHCFVMARATIQFWRFARFDPNSPAVSDAELERRIEQVVGRHPSHACLPLDERVVFPGYANLRDLSSRQGPLLRKHLGSSLATYFRPGNFFLTSEPSPEHQARTNEELETWLRMGQPMALWIYDFKFPSPTLNHAVVAFAQCGKLFYFPGGKASVRPCYVSFFE
jgi:hypothetical protein